jgi:hypothetical protein
MDNHVKLILGGINPCREHGRFCHLLRPCLVKRTGVQATIRVRRRGWRDLAIQEPTMAQGGRSRRQPARPWVSTWGRALPSEHTKYNASGYYKGGKALPPDP